jgi:hypothetical protein
VLLFARANAEGSGARARYLLNEKSVRAAAAGARARRATVWPLEREQRGGRGVRKGASEGRDPDAAHLAPQVFARSLENKDLNGTCLCAQFLVSVVVFANPITVH